MNCLTHLLELFNQGHRFVLITNEDHFVGVNDKKIFELGDAFKKDLQRGYSIGGGDRYLPLDIEDIERIKRVFKLDDKYSQILDDYGAYIVSSDTYYQK